MLCEVTGYIWPRAERREHEERGEWNLILTTIAVVRSLISSNRSVKILPGSVW